MEAEHASVGFGSGDRGYFNVPRERKEKDDEDKPAQRISQQDGAIRVQGGHPAGAQQLGQPAARQRAHRGREGSDEVIPCKSPRAFFVRQELRQGGLFNGQERTDLVSARTDDTDDGGSQEEEDVAGDDEDNARAQHQQRADDQRALASDTVSGGSEPERNARIAHEGEGEEQADLLFDETYLREIEREDDREEAVAKESYDAGGEKNDHVVNRFFRHGFHSLHSFVKNKAASQK